MLEICCLKNSIVKRLKGIIGIVLSRQYLLRLIAPLLGVVGYKESACVLFRCSHLMGVKRETSMRAVQQQNVMLPKSLG